MGNMNVDQYYRIFERYDKEYGNKNGQIDDTNDEKQKIKQDVLTGKLNTQEAKAAVEAGYVSRSEISEAANNGSITSQYAQSVLSTEQDVSSYATEATAPAGYGAGEFNIPLTPQTPPAAPVTEAETSSAETVSASGTAETQGTAEKTPLQRAYENPAVLYAFDKLPQMDANGQVMKDAEGNVLIDENSTGDGKLSDDGDIKEMSRFHEYIRQLNNLGEDDEISQEHIDKAVNQLTKDMAEDIAKNKGTEGLKDLTDSIKDLTDSTKENSAAIQDLAAQTAALAEIAANTASALEGIANRTSSNVKIPDMPKIAGSAADAPAVKASFDNLESILKPEPDENGNDAVLRSSQELQAKRDAMNTAEQTMTEKETAYYEQFNQKLESASDEQKQNINSKKTEIEDKNTEITGKQEEIDTKNNDIADKKVDIAKSEDAVQTAEGKVQTASDAVAAANSALSAAQALSDDDENKADAVAAATQALQKASEELKAANKELDDAKKKLEEEKAALAELEEGLETLEDEMETLEGDLKTLETELKDLETEVIGDDQDAAALKDAYYESKSAYENAKSEYEEAYKDQQEELEKQNKADRQAERSRLNTQSRNDYINNTYTNYLNENVYKYINPEEE